MTDAKQQLVKSWLTRAQHDLSSSRVLVATTPPLYDTAIYHCQQAAEKAIKAYLVFCDKEFERIHDLEVLIRDAIPYEIRFTAWVDRGRRLTPYATLFRYPGFAMEPNREQFEQALLTANEFYNFVLSLLPSTVLPDP